MISTPIAPPPAGTDSPEQMPALIAQLADTNPSMGLDLVRLLGAAAPSVRAAAEAHLVGALADDRVLNAEVDAYVLRAGAAQEAFENWTDERVDEMALDLAKAFASRAGELAEAAVKETGIGNIRDKTIKIRFASLGVYDSIAGKTAQGPLAFDADRQITEIASPVGVVFGVVPLTNPIATAIFKTLINLKARNALILSFPRQAAGLAEKSGGIIRTVIRAHGAPVNLVQWTGHQGNRRLTRKFMCHPKVSLILATGGAGLVSAAYSSGTPAIGVGPGNAPAWICADADLDRAARAIVTSKAFDNGLVAVPSTISSLTIV
jgi:acetaldehyde dehydrogenase/alcohol dehydrogenase